MAQPKNNDQRAAGNPTATTQPEPSANRDTRVPIRRKRVKGTLKEPVYLIHHGKFEVKVPAVTRETIIDDPDDERYGEVVTEEVVAETISKGELPKDSRFGRRKVGVAHEIVDIQEAEDLKARGFVPATKEEIENSARAEKSKNGGKTIDEIAAEQRVKAQQSLRRTRGGTRTRETDEE